MSHVDLIPMLRLDGPEFDREIAAARLDLAAMEAGAATLAEHLEALETGRAGWQEIYPDLRGAGRKEAAVEQCAGELAELRERIAAARAGRP